MFQYCFLHSPPFSEKTKIQKKTLCLITLVFENMSSHILANIFQLRELCRVTWSNSDTLLNVLRAEIINLEFWDNTALMKHLLPKICPLMSWTRCTNFFLVDTVAKQRTFFGRTKSFKCFTMICTPMQCIFPSVQTTCGNYNI